MLLLYKSKIPESSYAVPTVYKKTSQTTKNKIKNILDVANIGLHLCMPPRTVNSKVGEDKASIVLIDHLELYSLQSTTEL
jgi:hypothetical protein